jgi:hypothetical protein
MRCASAWSFQKSGSEIRVSRRVSSSSGLAASKIAPQVGGAFREILIAANLIVESDGHDVSPSQSHVVQPFRPAGCRRQA